MAYVRKTIDEYHIEGIYGDKRYLLFIIESDLNEAIDIMETYKNGHRKLCKFQFDDFKIIKKSRRV